MKAKRIYRDVKAFLATALNPRLAFEAAELEVPVDLVTEFSLGWRDPFRLPSYNALMVVPDLLKPNRENLTLSIPIALVAAIRSASVETLTDAMGIYADAIMGVFQDDPSAGGACLEALVDDVDFSLPVPGAGSIGVVTVLATVSLDQVF